MLWKVQLRQFERNQLRPASSCGLASPKGGLQTFRPGSVALGGNRFQAVEDLTEETSKLFEETHGDTCCLGAHSFRFNFRLCISVHLVLFRQSVTVWSSGDVMRRVISSHISCRSREDLLQGSWRPSWRSRAAAAAVQSAGSPSAKAESQTAVISTE